MLVSIIINNYNYARYLAAAIDSALAQTWHPLEVIVVDDGSTDDSWAVIERYGDRVHAIRQPNGGQGAAYNAGFAASRGEWVMFLDSDDLLDVRRAGAHAVVRRRTRWSRCRAICAASTPMASRSAAQCPTSRTTATCGRSSNAFRQYGAPPSSGNLYRRRAIAPYFPMHAPAWRRSADTVPSLLCVFHGLVVTVPGTIGCYRLAHDAARRSGLARQHGPLRPVAR